MSAASIGRRIGVTTLLLAACAPPRSGPTLAPAPPFTVARPAGERAYVFVSRQTGPAGTSRVQVTFTLVTSAAGSETAQLTVYQRALGDAPFAPGEIAESCRRGLAAPPGVIAVLPVTPPPSRLADLIPDCVPEDLFGAATDILPLLMIQMQPAFRAAELRAAGERLRFDGFETAWRLPPAMLDARVVADSGVVSLDSLAPTRAVIGWDTSPMRIDLVRLIAPGRRALLSGQEWFRAQIAVDPRSGALLEGRTLLDSLALQMVMPYPDSMVPPAGARPGLQSGRPIVLTRSLDLRPLPPRAERP